MDSKHEHSAPPVDVELRCTNCGKVCEVVNNGEYIVPVSKCCTAYIQEFKIFKAGTTKV